MGSSIELLAMQSTKNCEVTGITGWGSVVPGTKVKVRLTLSKVRGGWAIHTL